MILQKETHLGRITVTDKVFSEMLLSLMEEDEFKDRIWAATKKGKIIQRGAAFADSDISSMLRIERDKEERLCLDLSTVVRFGLSINEITEALSDRIAKLIEIHDGKPPGKITIEVTGIKGATVQKRNIEMIREYGD